MLRPNIAFHTQNYSITGKHGINFSTILEFEDPETALVIYKILLRSEYRHNNLHFDQTTMDKLRTHFGLLLHGDELIPKVAAANGSLHTFIPVNTYPKQNTEIFTKHMPYIRQKMLEIPPALAPNDSQRYL